MSVSSLSYTSVLRVNSMAPMISSVTNMSSGIIAQFCDDVEQEINSILGNRFAVPITANVPMLAAIATREAIYRITVQRALVQFPPAQQGRHPLQQQHIDDQKLLQELGTGAKAMITSSGDVVTIRSDEMMIWSTTKEYTPTFSEGEWTDQIQDPDKLDDDLSNRGLT